MEDLPPDSSSREFAEAILRSGQRARDVVRQILAFSRRQPGERTHVAVAPLLDEAATMVRATLPSTIHLNLLMDDTDAAVTGDPTQLSQVILNLCVNASDALTGRHGELTLRLSTGPAPAAPEKAHAPGEFFGAIDLDVTSGAVGRMWIGTCEGAQRCVRIDVEDDGPGIPPDVLSRIFEPFFTTKPKGKGTGLGLSAVLGIVSDHRGAICVDSLPGRGTRFSIFLPVSDEEAADGPGEAERPRAVGKARILVVEDDEEVAGMLGLALARQGHEARRARNGREALDILRAGEAVDMILTDQTMPEMTGLELLKAIRREGRDTPVLMMTGHSDTLDEHAAMAAGARRLLLKPIASDLLAHAIEDALRVPS